MAQRARKCSHILGTAALLTVAVSLPLSAATVHGRVVFQGEVPATESIEIAQDTAVCGESSERSSVVVSDDGGLHWAVVTLSGGGSPAGEPTPDLVQKGCAFAPRVVVTAPGVELGVLNEDGILHNVHTYSEENAVVNLAQPGFVNRLPLTFEHSERVRVTCDVHSWMEGWIVVSDNPATAVTDATGAFSFDDVPAGEHEVRVWHPVLGEQSAQVVVEEGATATITVEIEG